MPDHIDDHAAFALKYSFAAMPRFIGVDLAKDEDRETVVEGRILDDGTYKVERILTVHRNE